MSFSRCCPLLEKKATLLGQMMPVGLQRGRAHLRWPGFPVLSPIMPRDTVQPSSAIPPAPLCFLRAGARVRGQKGEKERRSGKGQKAALVKLFITLSFKG